MKLWIARDNYGFLGLYKKCPIWGKINELDEDWKGEFIAFLPKSFFTEVTFENSPQVVELKIIK